MSVPGEELVQRPLCEKDPGIFEDLGAASGARYSWWGPWQMTVLAAQSCLTLCDPKDCIPSGSSTHGLAQARTLKRVTIPFFRGSSRPRDPTWVSPRAGSFFTIWTSREGRELGLNERHLGKPNLGLFIWDELMGDRRSKVGSKTRGERDGEGLGGTAGALSARWAERGEEADEGPALRPQGALDPRLRRQRLPGGEQGAAEGSPVTWLLCEAWIDAGSRNRQVTHMELIKIQQTRDDGSLRCRGGRWAERKQGVSRRPSSVGSTGFGEQLKVWRMKSRCNLEITTPFNTRNSFRK